MKGIPLTKKVLLIMGLLLCLLFLVVIIMGGYLIWKVYIEPGTDTGEIFEILKGEDEKKCLEMGGDVEIAKLGSFCNIRTSDAGKSCINNSDCEGYCICDEDGEACEGEISGHCDDHKDRVGCFTYMEEGKPYQICVD